MRELLRPARVWLIVFLLLPWMDWQPAMVNPGSRFATMSAMSQQGTFQIDDYQMLTYDWARRPDGHFYSNKAPGAMFIGFPFTWVWDRVHHRVTGAPLLDQNPRSDLYQLAICYLFQILPCCWVTIAALRRLESASALAGYGGTSVSRAALHFSALAILFGNTAAIYMSSYLGHGMAAIFTLAAMLALDSSSYVWLGWWFGLGALTDYGGIFLVPALVAAYFSIAANRRLSIAAHARVAGQLMIGAAIPAGLWIWYHTSAFGSPFTLPFQYQNPMFVEVVRSAAKPGLWGVANVFPDPVALFKLILGSDRGIVFTQPWILIALAALPSYWRRLEPVRHWIVFGLVGLAGLLWMNGAFVTWWGGNTPGPRYLSPIFPVLALVTGSLYDRLPHAVRRLLWAGLAVALVLRIVVYATNIYPPYGPAVWRYYLDAFTHAPLPKRDVQLIYVLVSMIAAMVVTRILERMTRRPSASPVTEPELAR